MLGASPRAASGARSTSRSRRAALLVAAGFAFAISLGEFGATVFIARPDDPTLPVVIYRLLGQPGAHELRRRDGREHDPHGAHRGGGARRSSGSRVGDVGDVLMLEVDASSRVRYGDARRASTAST